MTAGRPLRPDTVAIHGGRGDARPGDPVNVPPVLSSVFRGGDGPPGYARQQNPTWEALEEVLGALEGGHAVTFASGIAAVDATLSLVADGSRIVAPFDAYTGMRGLLADAQARGRLDVRLVDVVDTAATLDACDDARLLWLESPTNPLMGVPDLAALIEGARDRGVLVAVDNTFATPLRQRPLDLGADVVVHSATKFLSGHSDVLAGAAIVADPARRAPIATYRTSRGAVPGPVEAWLVLRGLRTLPVRLDRCEANAAELARRLDAHPAVTRVRYPGLHSDPGHERAAAQMTGFGAVLSIELADVAAADALCRDVRVALHATSLGGVETTLERRARQPLEEAVPDELVRVSVGCENVDDLWDDLASALDGAGRAGGEAVR
jgi:cystathionine gamma-synthase